MPTKNLEHVDVDRLRQHVQFLARAPRPGGSASLAECRNYVTSLMQEFGWQIQAQTFQVRLPDGPRLAGTNLVARRTGHFQGNRPRFIIGAHLDTKPQSPGADDNASAVAGLLEIARLLPSIWPAMESIDLELVGFDLEEIGMLGGAFHAETLKKDPVSVAGMISLEMIGYSDSTPGSQNLPPLPPELLKQYSRTGDFIAVVGNQNSTTLISDCARALRQIPNQKVEVLQVPDNGMTLPMTRLSDHSPFWDAGFPALMVTDTSFLRNPHYHLATDTIETLDFEFLGRVTEGMIRFSSTVLNPCGS